MKKLVFAMMAIVALSFASCDKTATVNNESRTTSVVDPLAGDTTVDATLQEASGDSTQAEAPAQEAATESAQENK